MPQEIRSIASLHSTLHCLPPLFFLSVGGTFFRSTYVERFKTCGFLLCTCTFLVRSAYGAYFLHSPVSLYSLTGQSLYGAVDEDEDALNCCVNQDRLWHMMPTYSWSFNFTSNPFANEELPTERDLVTASGTIDTSVGLCDSLPFKLGSSGWCCAGQPCK